MYVARNPARHISCPSIYLLDLKVIRVSDKAFLLYTAICFFFLFFSFFKSSYIDRRTDRDCFYIGEKEKGKRKKKVAFLIPFKIAEFLRRDELDDGHTCRFCYGTSARLMFRLAALSLSLCS